jgi:hypothetical protein
MVNDMNSAASDLKTQFSNLRANTPPTNTSNGAEQALGKMTGDWQRILSDQAAIIATSNAEVNFIHSAAIAEFQEGDLSDAVILFVGPLLGINPTSALITPVGQAISIVNDPTLQSIVNQNLHTVNTHVDSTVPISQLTVAPSF